MYKIGKKEINRIERLFNSGQIFRYGMGGECEEFERRWADQVGVSYCRLSRSGTSALYTALVGMQIGPGDQVIVPAYTYMATALAVLAVGAIPVVADINTSLTLCPKDFEKRITQYTRAVIPVHMAGLPCDMKKIKKIAKKHNVLILEDACQAVGGGYEGKPLGSWGDAGAFSFNYYKNMTCGEGGAFVTNDQNIYDRGSVAVDCCSFYWNPDEEREDLQFAGHNFRASEIEGAILNVQAGRIGHLLKKMRKHKSELLKVVVDSGLKSIKNNSIEFECGTHLGLIFRNEALARKFSNYLANSKVSSFLPMDTGRHVYTRWEPILRYQGAHHPALDPFKLEANKNVLIEYHEKMCNDSLKILSRSVLIPMHPDNSTARIGKIADLISCAMA